MPASERCEIPLDDLAKQMATERRRIYDIVNVLEAVQMMTKVLLKQKNLDLEWSTLGITSLPTLKIFQESSSFLSQLAQIFHETSHHAPA